MLEENMTTNKIAMFVDFDLLMEQALREIGSTWFYDSFYLFGFTTLGLVSLVTNLISYFIFNGPFFARKPLYAYLKVSCLNSALVSLFSITNLLWSSRRYHAFANTELATILRCYIKHPVILVGYFYGSMLDIVFALERLAEITNLRAEFRRFRPVRVCLLLFTLCFLLNLPYIFLFTPQKRFLSEHHTNVTEYFFGYGESNFALNTTIGVVLKRTQYFVRDVLTLVVLISVNVISLVNFKRKYYLAENNGIKPNNSRRGSSELMVNVRSFRTDNGSSLSLKLLNVDRSLLYFSVVKLNKKLTIMVFIICFISSVEHIFMVLGIELFTRYSGHQLKFFLVFMTNLSVLVKHSLNFFIFYNYNNFFKVRFLNLVRTKIVCFKSGRLR
jgi:hypothetical protein